jgi:prepilin signal peptidase PulO-like enzyme (type II secretory pathway)
LDLLAGIIGLIVGSLLNLWAHKSLNQLGYSASRLVCEHRKKLSELVPLVPYLSHRGKCEHCRSGIPWYYPLVEIITAVFFIAILRYFGWSIYGFAMLFFVSVLITVCITDFKERIIPHEITYPAIILGIIFSAVVRQDFMGTLAGIGISYIFFDFLAFYGLKIYLLYNKPQLVQQSQARSSYTQTIDSTSRSTTTATATRQPTKTLSRTLSLAPTVEFIKRKRKQISNTTFVLPGGQPLDEFEVMGGGDAVLAALISAWLGLPKLLLALMVSFAAGTLLGAGYLLFELQKQKLLASLVRTLVIAAGLGAAAFIAISIVLTQLFQQSLSSLHWLVVLFLGAMIGALIRLIQSGSHVSKPFPFGPALAIGAVIALF